MSDQEITFSPPMSVDTSAFALLADLQYHEPFASEALNRKFYGIIPPGIYRGFQYVLPGGMTLRIGRPSEAGSAIIHVGDRCITVQQYKPVDLVVAAGFVGRVVLEGFYQLGVKTKQVDSASTIDAVSIKLVTEAQYKPDHVTLYNLNVPANATAMQASYIIDAKRDDVDIAVDSSVYRDLAEHIASPTAHTKAQVGLSNVNNWPATASVNDPSDATYATAGAVKRAYDLAASKLDSGGTAAAATKLATPRQINGTNFDGTANITTANWGTDRTLTIGNAAKSVNGGGNVAWSLTEIGAAEVLNKAIVIPAISGTSGATLKTQKDNAGGADDKETWLTDKPTSVTTHKAIGIKTTLGPVYWNGTTSRRIYNEDFKPTASDVGLGNANNTADSAKNVLSATKLTTPRQINGTNFDGTANITTANWGTARTLTIGNTAKSVNGGGNVAWSLAEIGAAPEGHGLGTYAGGVSNTTTDLRTKSGFYNASGATGEPVGGHTWKYYFNAAHSNAAGYNGTIAMDFDGGVLAFRAISGGADRGWKYVYHSGNKPSAADVGLGSVNNTADSAKNVLSATKLATPRQINGTNFDGTGDITFSQLAGNSYFGGGLEKPNYFGAGKLRYQMLGAGTGGAAAGLGAYCDALWISSYTGNDVKRSNLLLMSKDSARIGFRQASYDATDWGPLYQIYHTGYKPTATDINALPSSGGDITGNIRSTATYRTTIDQTLGFVMQRPGKPNLVGIGQAGDGSAVVGYGAEAAVTAYLKIGPDTLQADIGSGIKKIYHEGFKPTATDVGALRSSSYGADLNNLDVSGQYLLRQEVTNKPVGASGIGDHIIHQQWDANAAYQIYTEFLESSKGKMWTRNKSGGKWGVWKQVYDTVNKPTAADVGAISKSGDTLPNGSTINDHTAGNLNIIGANNGFYGARNGAFLVNNAWYNGVAWAKFDNARPSGVICVRDGVPEFRYSAGGETDPAATQYRIYHSGFKPTADDVGATSLNSGFGRSTFGAAFGDAVPIKDRRGFSNVTRCYNAPDAPLAGVYLNVMTMPETGNGTSSFLATGISANGLWVGNGASAINWQRVYTTSFKPTADDVGLGNVPNMAHNIEAQVSTVPIRDGSGDIKARLFRSNYGGESGIASSAGIAFRNSTSDDYVRFCTSPAAIRGWLGLSAVENKAWVRVASGACNLNLANGRDVYVGRFSTGVAFAGRTFDQGRYRIVMKTTGSVSTGNADALWWSVRGEILPVQYWSKTSLHVEVYCSGGDIQSGKVDQWELYEWK